MSESYRIEVVGDEAFLVDASGHIVAKYPKIPEPGDTITYTFSGSEIRVGVKPPSTETLPK